MKHNKILDCQKRFRGYGIGHYVAHPTLSFKECWQLGSSYLDRGGGGGIPQNGGSEFGMYPEVVIMSSSITASPKGCPSLLSSCTLPKLPPGKSPKESA